MDEQTQNKFFKKYGPILALVSGILATVFLVLMVVSLQIHAGITTYGEAVYMAFGFLLIGILFISMHKINVSFDAVASMSFIMAIPMFLLIYMYMSDEFSEISLPITYYVFLVLAILLTSLSSLLAISVSFIEKPISTRDMAEEGILLALAFILNLIGFRVVKGGGSINLQMLPLFIIALRRGPVHGLVCGGIIYGLVTCLTDGYGLATYPFDYLIGFGSVMVLGLFRKLIMGEKQKGYNFKGELFLLIGGTLATLVRFIGSTASSMIIYQYSFMASVAYNVTYIPLSGLFAIVFIMVIYGPLLKIHRRFPVHKSVQ